VKKPWNLEVSPKKRRRLNAFIMTLFVSVITFTYATNISLGTQDRVEFGQGVRQTVTCDTYVNLKLTSRVNATTGVFYIDQLTLSDLSLRLHDRTITIELIAQDGSTLNNSLSFSVGSDGLTYTSTRAHVDVLDAFTAGLGTNAEFGSSQITFTSLGTIGINSLPIPSDSVANVVLQTSGSGSCTTPSNLKAVEVYVDAPYVQGSYIPELYPAASLVDNYNNSVVRSGDNCPSSGTVGTYSGNCRVFFRTQDVGGYVYGGALTTTSTPRTAGNVNDQSPSAAVVTANGLTITFATRKNYVGFWWSAGSTGNSIKFYRGNVLVATITGDDVYNAIPKNSTKLTARNGTTQYTKSNYYGHPLNTSTMDAGEPFVYFHCFAVNGFNFDKVVLATTGNGFEYDNFTVSNLSGDQLSPKNTLVFISSYNYSG
jgi:hypothetical protein